MLEIESEIITGEFELQPLLESIEREFGLTPGEQEESTREVRYLDTGGLDLLLSERSFKIALPRSGDATGGLTTFKRPVDTHGKLLVREKVEVGTRSDGEWKRVSDLFNELLWGLTEELFVEPRLLVREDSRTVQMTREEDGLRLSFDQLEYAHPDRPEESEEERVLELEADGIAAEELLEIVAHCQKKLNSRPAPEGKYPRGMRKLGLWPEGRKADAGIDLSID